MGDIVKLKPRRRAAPTPTVPTKPAARREVRAGIPMTREEAHELLRSVERVAGGRDRLLRAIYIDQATVRLMQKQRAQAARIVAQTFRGIDVERLRRNMLGLC